MAQPTDDEKEGRALLKVLTTHYHSLVSARSDEAILRRYSDLLRYLRSGGFKVLDPARAEHRPDRRLPSLLDAGTLGKASLDELERLVNDEAIPRKDLEFIAIERFSVPRGSMRSFYNRQMLVEKLHTLIRNERTHDTIRTVAREQANRTPDS